MSQTMDYKKRKYIQTAQKKMSDISKGMFELITSIKHDDHLKGICEYLRIELAPEYEENKGDPNLFRHIFRYLNSVEVEYHEEEGYNKMGANCKGCRVSRRKLKLLS